MARHKIDKHTIFLPVWTMQDAVLALNEEAQDLWLTAEWEEFIPSLMIMTKDEGLQPLIYNDAQLEFWELVCAARRENRPGFFIILKYRQKGFSTEIQSIIFTDTLKRPNRNSYIASFEGEHAEYVMGMDHIFWENLAPDIKARRKLRVQTKLQLWFSSPHNSRIRGATANRRFLASGQTIHNFHATELAKWPDPPAKDAFQSIMNAVPHHWDTLRVVESTAYGFNFFKDMWDAANAKGTEGWNGFDPVFISPKGRPDCFIQVTEDIVFSKRERDLQKQVDICDRQLAWWQLMKRTKCHGNWDEAMQEYPWRPSDAFKFSGQAWFDPEGIEWLEQFLMKPIAIGELLWAHAEYPVVKWRDITDGLIEIFEWPKTDVNYVISADPSEGVGGKGDFLSIGVYAIPSEPGRPPRQVAHATSNHITAADAGEILFQLGIFYNRAFIIVEINNQGILTCNTLQEGTRTSQMEGGYPSLYYRTVIDEKTEQETQKLGWHTKDHSTRDLMFGDLKDAVKQNNIIMRSHITWLQMQGFSYDPQKHNWVSMYKHPITGVCYDDEVVQIAIALQGIKKRRQSRATDYKRGEE